MPSADAQSDPRARGLSRRGFLVTVGAVGAAALVPDGVLTRTAFAGPPAPRNAVVTVFLRGGADGLRILVPHSVELGRDYLKAVRGPLMPADGRLVPLPGTAGWALNAALRPLYDMLWAGRELAFVPAVSAPGVTRSHFQAQQHVERGGQPNASDGWWDRALRQLAGDSPFRAVSVGGRSPASMAGDQPKLALASLAQFGYPGRAELRARSQAALAGLYAGLPGPLAQDVRATLTAVDTADGIRAAHAAVQNGAVYPPGPLSTALQDLAAIPRAEVGLTAATVDVGGFDTHTDEADVLDKALTGVAGSLAAFMTDLGPARRSRVTVVVQTEFGRRVPVNANAGADHGTAGLVWLLGGGVAGGVHGRWRPLMAEADLVAGDVPTLNNVFDVLGEVVQKRLGVGSLGQVFPGHAYAPLGVARSA